MANDTEFGLAAYVFTQSAARQWRVGEALEYGMVELTQEQFQMKLRHLVELNNQA
jgi:acyl-CoA reductase-like NAD-dependent aldehyde dehydrogenase